MNEKVKIPATKAEIARVYEMSASTLQKIIKRNISKFDGTDYRPRQHIMSPKQREIIREILGDPVNT